MAIEYIWVENPAGRKIEVEKSRLQELVQRGYKLVRKDELPKEELEKEFLDVVEI